MCREVGRGVERSTKKDLHPRYSIAPPDAVLEHTNPDLYRARNVAIIMSLMPAIFGCKPRGVRTCPQYYVCDDRNIMVWAAIYNPGYFLLLSMIPLPKTRYGVQRTTI